MTYKNIIIYAGILSLSLLTIPFKEAFSHPVSSHGKSWSKHNNTTQADEFERFLNEIRVEAIQHGISQKTIDAHLSGLTLQSKPLHRIKHQAHKELTFEEYQSLLISKDRVAAGQNFYKENLELLQKIEKEYHVQPGILTAIFGIESMYGNKLGTSPMVPSLATLAFQHHRSSFFRGQLIAALKILDNPNIIPEATLSTYDGGMGLPQFEPTTYLQYAVDFEKTGFKNIWTSIPNALASIANYLNKMGWKDSETWGVEVKVSHDIPSDLANNIKEERTLEEWNKLGIRTIKGDELSSKLSPKASLLLPDGPKGRAFLVFHNFKVLLRWNNIHQEGLTIGMLANQLASPHKPSNFVVR